MFPRIFILCCGLHLGLAYAETETPAAPASEIVVVPVSAEEKEQMLARAAQLNIDADKLRGEATQRHEAAKAECWKKLLVSSCLEDVRQIFRKDDARASKMQREARLLERNVKRYDAAEHAAQREAENARKDAAAQAKEAEARAKQEAK